MLLLPLLLMPLMLLSLLLLLLLLMYLLLSPHADWCPRLDWRHVHRQLPN
jgi:hypothetical protein